MTTYRLLSFCSVKEARHKGHINDVTSVKCPEQANPETHRGWGTQGEWGVTNDENVLESDSGDGCTTW